MTTKKQREFAFRAELAELLEKHGAELEVTDDGKPWGMHSGVCKVTMASEFDSDGIMVKEFAEFNL